MQINKIFLHIPLLRRNLFKHGVRDLLHAGGSRTAREAVHGIHHGIGSPSSRLPDGIGGFERGVAQRSITSPVVERTAGDNGDVVGQVERGCDSEHGDEEEEDRVYEEEMLACRPVAGSGEWYRRRVLKTNFSVGVSMYSAKVTSYWYFFFCTHFAKSVG